MLKRLKLGGLTLAILAGSVWGCISSQEKPKLQDFQQEQSWIIGREKGLDEVRVVEPEGIKEIVFYKDDKPIYSASNVEELLKIPGEWEMGGRDDGMIESIDKAPKQKPFREYLISTIKGRGVLPEEKAGKITLEIYDKQDNPVRSEDTSRWYRE